MSSPSDSRPRHERDVEHARPRFTAVVTRESDWWRVEVPELGGLVLHTSDADGVDEAVRDAAVFVRDMDPVSFDLQVVFDRIHEPALAPEEAVGGSPSD